MQYHWHIFNDFSKGINQAVSDHLLKDNEASWQKNVYLGNRHQGYGGRGALQKRPGSSLHKAQRFTPGGELNIHGIGYYRFKLSDDNTVDVGVCAAGDRLYNYVNDHYTPNNLWYAMSTDEFNPNGNRVEFATINNLIIVATGENLWYADLSSDDWQLRPLVGNPPPGVTMGITTVYSGPGALTTSSIYRYKLAFINADRGLSEYTNYTEVTLSATQDSVRFSQGGGTAFPQPPPNQGWTGHVLFRTKANSTSEYYVHPTFWQIQYGNFPEGLRTDRLITTEIFEDHQEDIFLRSPIWYTINDRPEKTSKSPLSYASRLYWASGNRLWYSERGEPLKYEVDGVPNFWNITSQNNELLDNLITRNGILCLSRNSVHLFNADPPSLRPISASVGIASGFAGASDGNAGYWLSQENKIYKCDGINLEEISTLIENELKHLNSDDWEEVSMAVYDDLLYVTIPEGRTFVYGLRTGDWTEYTGWNVKYMASSPNMLNQKLYFILRSGEYTPRLLSPRTPEIETKLL